MSGATNEAQARTGKSPVKGQAPFAGAAARRAGRDRGRGVRRGRQGQELEGPHADNDLGAFRDTGVEIQPTTDPDGGGYHVAGRQGRVGRVHDQPSRRRARTRSSCALAAPAGFGGTAGASVDGKKATVGGSFALPATGGWDVWQTAAGVVNLKAGVQVLRLCVDTAADPAGDAAAVNWLRLTPAETSAAEPASASQAPAKPKRSAALKPARVFDAVFNTAAPITPDCSRDNPDAPTAAQMLPT